jgi:hypothetical protein
MLNLVVEMGQYVIKIIFSRDRNYAVTFIAAEDYI